MCAALVSRGFALCLCLVFGVARSLCAEEFREYTADATAQYVQVAFSPDNQLLAGVGLLAKTKRALVVLWDMGSGKVVARISDFPEECARIAFSPDSTMLAVGCGNGAIHIFGRSRDIWRRIHVIQHRPSTKYNMSEEFQFSADSQRLISTCQVFDVGIVMVCRGLAVNSLGGKGEQNQFIPLQPSHVMDLHLLDGAGRRVLISRKDFTARMAPQLSVVEGVAGSVVKFVPIPPLPNTEAKGDGNFALKATFDGSRIVLVNGTQVYDVAPDLSDFKQRIAFGRIDC